VIGRYLTALLDGDPVALGFTALFAVIAVVLGIFVLITKRKLDAEDAREEAPRLLSRSRRTITG
jgi:hypothetical protein